MFAEPRNFRRMMVRQKTFKKLDGLDLKQTIMLTSSGDVPSRSVQKTRWICLLSFSKVCKLSNMEDLVMWFLPCVAYTADLIVEDRKTAPGSPLSEKKV